MSPQPGESTGAAGVYRGRLAPSPTGFLHLGHARTFWTAQQRARERGGVLVLRNEDLDPARSRPEFAAAMMEDLRWFGFDWQEGPDGGGPFAPYVQSERRTLYREAFEKLRAGGWVYPCFCSRQEVQRALQAPHAGDEEPVYPGTCRPRPDLESGSGEAAEATRAKRNVQRSPNWRFRVPEGEVIAFHDHGLGPRSFTAGRDFGDFIVWRHDDVPSYQLAVVADDAAMHITEVVRGADLLVSTARQILLYRSLGWTVPEFYHCPLMTDEHGVRLAKRHDALSLRALRERGESPEKIRAKWDSKIATEPRR
jgi:glutamyl-tRNA synthetase